MRDQLKAQIEAQKEKFELELPQGHMGRFQQKLSAQKSKSYLGFYKMVASIVLLIGVGYVFFQLGKTQSVGLNTNETLQMAELPEEFKEAEVFFANQVQEKKKELIALEDMHLDATSQLLAELDNLEDQYNALKVELAQNRDNQRIVNAMIQNYRTRLS